MAVRSLTTRQMIMEYRQAGGPYVDMVDWDFLRLNALRYPNREALVDTWQEPWRRITWQELYEQVNLVVAALLEQGIKRDDLVYIQMPNMIENYLVRIACTKLRAISASVQYNLREEELTTYYRRQTPEVIVIPAAFRKINYVDMYQKIRREVQLKRIYVVGEKVGKGMQSFSTLLDPKVKDKYSIHALDRLKPRVTDYTIIPSGGTTGTPKLALQNQLYWQRLGMELGRNVELTANDTILVLAPLAGGVGSTRGYIGPLVAGAKVVALTNLTDFDPELCLRLVQAEKVTIIAGVLAYLVRMLNSPNFSSYDISSVRAFVNGGGFLSRETQQRMRAMGIIPVDLYALVETGLIAMTNIHDGPEITEHFVGRVSPGGRVKIVDDSGKALPVGQEGEIVTRGIHCGYLGNPRANKETFKHGWCYTGDIGKVNQEGYLAITGRKKDMILRGARNIFPGAVEQVFIKHPKIKEAAVIGMPDRDLGERICAYVVTRENQGLTLDEMKAYLTQQGVTKQEFPERLEIIEALPLSVGGKVAKRDLRADITRKLKAEGKI